MRDIIDNVNEWEQAGKSIALATVVKVFGSAPREMGAKMAVTSDNDIAGSVSGGCVESAVIEAAIKSLKTGLPVLLKYQIEKENAWSVGLSCGGELEVFVEPLINPSERLALNPPEIFNEVKDKISKESPCIQVTKMDGAYIGRKTIYSEIGDYLAGHQDFWVDEMIKKDSYKILEDNRAIRAIVKKEESEEDIFIEVFNPRDKLIIIGAGHIAIPLVSFAKKLGFYTTVMDARNLFANRERFQDADEIIVDWPAKALEETKLDRTTYVVLTSHDEKVDLPVIGYLAHSPIKYLGVLGSRKTHEKRVEKLLEMGIGEEKINNMHAPVGLKIGATSAEEIALSIMAEIISIKRKK